MATARRNLTKQEIQSAWDKVPDARDTLKNYFGEQAATGFKKDYAGAWIRWDDHGNNNMGEFQWQVDHIKPLAVNGQYTEDNMLAIHIENNQGKQDDYPVWKTTKTSKGFLHNVNGVQYWKMNEQGEIITATEEEYNRLFNHD